MRWSSLVFLLTFTSVAHAEAPYEGRHLPEGIKRAIWDKACDVIPRASVDCAAEPCIFRDARGEAFSPAVYPWQNLLMYEHVTGVNVLVPGLTESRLGTKGAEADARVAISLLSGLPLDLDPNDSMLQLNPLLVRWVTRELLPPATTPMCGVSARELYDRAFKGPVRQAMDVYAQIKARGHARGLAEADVAREFSTRKGRLAATCQAVQKKGAAETAWSRDIMCWWWLRRVATGGADEVAQLLGRALAEYDVEGLKSFGKVVPKAGPARPVKLVPLKQREIRTF